MKSSKPKRKKIAKSDFAVMAEKAMRRAQRNAARESARWGLPLVLGKPR